MDYLLIGKPNVGKSSIYNILTGSNKNIVHPEGGTTRDWHFNQIKDSSSLIYDTPGILINSNNRNNFNFSFSSIINKESLSFIYVVDYQEGFNNLDYFAISQLRKFDKKIFLIVNKFDNNKIIPNPDFLKYSINNILYISCSHRYGFENLKLILRISKSNLKVKDNVRFSIAVFGKPNAGKSTFLNTVLGFKRFETSKLAGTTTDIVSDTFQYKNEEFMIIDTAGIGKKSNIKNKSLNFYSIKKTFENFYKVDTAIIIIDSMSGLDRQDKRIIKMVLNKSKSIILLFNKMDLINDKKKFKSEMHDQVNILSDVKNIKFFFITSFSKVHIKLVLNYLYDSILKSNYSISTSKLNNWLKFATNDKIHPLVEGKRINFKYVVQIKNKPVTLKIFCNYSKQLKNNYKRYLTNNFNNNFEIQNQKTKLIFTSSKNPYI